MVEGLQPHESSPCACEVVLVAAVVHKAPAFLALLASLLLRNSPTREVCAA